MPKSSGSVRAPDHSGIGSRTLERTLDGLYRVAHLVRDRLSLEAWQTLSKFRAGEPLARGTELGAAARESSTCSMKGSRPSPPSTASCTRT